ncbi:TPA: hypothetical protein IAA68_03770 [Candidatus Galligastranaerophilus faecipullorum]|nr:hypothetical protein [Candidatus Galligastranaerophilus faecipullorum]
MTHKYKRWYDYDPLLIEVINLLKNYQTELRSQAEVFLQKVEEQVSKEALDRFYEMVKPFNGNRWYDKDPVISKTVELLRVVPQQIQKQAADSFIEALRANGVVVEITEKSQDRN